MNTPDAAPNMLIVGRTGTGKTTLVTRYCSYLLARGDRKVLYLSAHPQNLPPEIPSDQAYAADNPTMAARLRNAFRDWTPEPPYVVVMDDAFDMFMDPQDHEPVPMLYYLRLTARSNTQFVITMRHAPRGGLADFFPDVIHLTGDWRHAAVR